MSEHQVKRRRRRAQIETVLAEYAKGVAAESSMELRRQASSAAQQNRELVTAWKKGVDARSSRATSSRPRPSTSSLEVAVERGRVAVAAGDRERRVGQQDDRRRAAVLETVAGYATAAQKQAVDFAAAQNTTAYDAAQQQFEASGSASGGDVPARRRHDRSRRSARVLGDQARRAELDSRVYYVPSAAMPGAPRPA